jgi:acetyl-CoA synthetase
MYRGEKALSVKATVDEALKHCTSVESVIVVRRDGREVTMVEGRDHWYHEAV